MGGETIRRILLLTADRSERGLLEPVMAELEKRKSIAVKWGELDSKLKPQENLSLLGTKLFEFNPDIVVVPCDRAEMVYAAAYSFHNGYVVCHFHAGNNRTGHPDDFNRRAISAFSHIMLCNMQQHKDNLIRQGEETWRIHVVGSTAFDNIHFDDLVTPIESFNLVILHPNSNIEKTERDLRDTIIYINGSFAKQTIWIYPNHDKNNELIRNFLDSFQHINNAECIHDSEWYYKNIVPLPQHITIYENPPRNQYLSLLKHCSSAIGNSSSFYYELPVVHPGARVLHVGERNCGLIVPETKIGGSERIVTILENIDLNESLREKKQK